MIFHNVTSFSDLSCSSHVYTLLYSKVNWILETEIDLTYKDVKNIIIYDTTMPLSERNTISGSDKIWILDSELVRVIKLDFQSTVFDSNTAIRGTLALKLNPNVIISDWTDVDML